MGTLEALNDGGGIQRQNLKDQAVRLLRSRIISGEITPGTALVERDLAELLRISRGPIREALLELEIQGLVHNVRGRRYVIEPSLMDLMAMFEIRTLLERKAAQRAAVEASPASLARLDQALKTMEQALDVRDRTAFVLADLTLHEEIWQAAGNIYLDKVLRHLSGPIFLAIINGSLEKFDWVNTFTLHRDLVECISRGDGASASQMVCRHMDDAIDRNESIALDPTPTGLTAHTKK